MKKTFLTVFSVCTFAIASTNAAEQNQTSSDADVAKRKAYHATIEKVPACQNILNECKKLGFVSGGFKEGKGLWRNCFHPVTEGKTASLKGQEVTVAASASDISACQAEIKNHHQMKEDKAAARKAKKSGESKSATPTTKE